MLFSKIILLTVILLVVFIYLNRAYAHIFDYDNIRNALTMDLQRNYTLEGKGQGDFKYVALGDSLTYGFGASNYKETFPFVFAQKLSPNYKKIEILNLAVSGAISSELLAGQLPKALAQNPDLVTIMVGTNDVHDFIKPEDFKKTLEETVKSLKKNTQTKILLINIPYLGTSTQVLPPYNIFFDRKINAFNKIIKTVAIEQQVNFFDLYSVSKIPFEKDPSLYSIDNFHPSGKGYILWGDLINAN